MASKNSLLGSGKPAEVVEPIVEEKKEVKSDKESNIYTPCWLYHITCPRGRIIEDDSEYEALINQGWSRRPVI